MSDAEAMREVKALIRWYECNGFNWLSAAEFTLAKHNGTLDVLFHPYRRALKVSSHD